MTDLRLRQLVLAANSLDTADQLKTILNLKPAYPDPEIIEFGLVNAVFAIGDQFLEVVVPVSDDAPVRRFIDRNGEGGYMILIQVPNIQSIRKNSDEMGIRRVWDADLDDIAASHFHPSDIGGTIVSLDQPKPPKSWRWGGPNWMNNRAEGKLTGARLLAPDAAEIQDIWARLMDQTPADNLSIETQEGYVEFEPSEKRALSRFDLEVPDVDGAIERAAALGCPIKGDCFVLANVEFHLKPVL